MNFRQRTPPPQTPGFQVTPMIDVFCCLLIFFIVTYNFSRAETSLEVKVPTAKEGKDVQRPISECIVNLTADGRLILNRQTLTMPQLEAKLRQLSNIYPDQAVILRADGHVDYAHAVEVMDAFRAANIWNVAFAVRPPQPSS